MKNLYPKELINDLLVRRKKYIIVSIILLIAAIICFTLFMVFTNRKNQVILSILNCLISAGILCFDFGFLSLKIMPLQRDIKFMRMISQSKEEIVVVKEFSFTSHTINKMNKTFFACLVNEYEYLIEENKKDMLPEKIKTIKVCGRFIVGVKEDDTQSI